MIFSPASARVPPIDAAHDDLIAGFMRAGSATTINAEHLYRIAWDWGSAIMQKRKTSTTETCRQLNAFDWSWPDFDTMCGILSEDDRWPTPWHHYKDKILSGGDLRDTRSKILVATARTAATSVRRAKDEQFRVMLRLEGWHLHVDSDVGAYYTEKFAGLVSRDIPETWPPFFPGDQTSIKLGGWGEVTTLSRR